LNNEVRKIFKQFEFNSLLWDNNEVKIKTWNDIWLKVKPINNKDDLGKLFDFILNIDEITLDTETTSLNIIDAELVWISIYIDDNNIFYINRLHKWSSINDNDLINFIEKLFKLEILIIWHNLKYDLEILELFIKNAWKKNSNNYNDKSNWQIQLEI
jgi:DNA polymerase I-like protein with 3'-5' exonuclease and polymerase domains